MGENEGGMGGKLWENWGKVMEDGERIGRTLCGHGKLGGGLGLGNNGKNRGMNG